MKRLTIYASSVVLLLLIVGAPSVAAERKFEKRFSVEAGGTITISTDVGDVEITGTSSNEVSVVADIHGRQRDVDEFDVSAWQSDKNVEVKGRSKRTRWFSWFDDSPEVKFHVMVPHEYSAHVNTSGGNITVSSMKGRIDGETSGGDLSIHDIEGAIKMETSGGNIFAEKLTGDLHMETSGGDIQILTIAGNVEVSTSGGNVKVSDVDGKIRAETSGGNIVVKAKNENKGIYAETSGGDIDIVVPKNISATIDASTTGGEVQCDLPVTMSGKFDESRIRGTVNGGGNSIRAFTSGGDVRIKTQD